MSITSASTASAGAVRSSSIGARPTRRPFVHTATTTALSKLDPRIPSNTARHALGPSNGHVANRVSGGGADRLVELLGQTGVRKRVSRYLMTSHSVIPSHAGHCRTGLWASLAMGHEKRPEPPPVGGTVLKVVTIDTKTAVGKLSFMTTSPAIRVQSYGRSFALLHAFASIHGGRPHRSSSDRFRDDHDEQVACAPGPGNGAVFPQ